MIKLLLVTWSYDDHYDLKNTFIYKSFIANNSESLIQHIHFNRNNYQKLEQEFNSKFGFQYEFILYKIFLLRDKLNDINTEYVIYSDTTDVVCLSDIQQIKFENSSKVLFSSEFHRYPNESTLSNWEPINQYTQSDIINRNFLNSGLYIGKTEKIIELLSYCIENILPKEYKNFGGDQGVYTYCYLNSAQKYIELDSNSNLFLSTYLRSSNEYLLQNDRLTHRTNKNSPIFVHDNGWNYGSPKFIEQFKLV
jgi:hypothetical protein